MNKPLVLKTPTHAETSPVLEDVKNKLVNLGRHLLVEFYECNANILNNVEYIEKVMVEAAIECGATVIQKNFHMFSPYGVSGVVIIAESHLAIHTWPELGYAAVDLFTCGESCDPKVAYAYLQEKFAAKSASYSELKRGLVPASALTDTSMGTAHNNGQTSSAQVLKMPFIVSHEESTGDGVELTPALRFSNLTHEVIQSNSTQQELAQQELVGGATK
ncbi:MAG: adenosylmethionine decarboxylase [Vampirovibrionales bacterium]|nr:adenosylmethionine decarboxylase [Vampirovibrionales bacterium]